MIYSTLSFFGFIRWLLNYDDDDMKMTLMMTMKNDTQKRHIKRQINQIEQHFAE